MYHLAIESQNAVKAVLGRITKDDIKQRDGKLVIRESIELSLTDDGGRPYLVHVPSGAEVCFWHVGGSSYGQKTKSSSYSSTRCTIFAPDSSFQLKYDSGRVEEFVFQWLANYPLLEAGRASARKVAQLI